MGLIDSRVVSDPSSGKSVFDALNEHASQMADIATNVKSKGAILDGVTDCTQYLVNAHDALPSAGGKIIIPPGKMLVSSKVTFTKLVILEGTSFRHLTGDYGSTILTTGSGELAFQGDGSGVRDLMVDGVSGNTGNGITMLCARPWLENVTASKQGGHGIQIGSDTVATNVNSFYLSNIHAKNNGGDGVRVTDISPTSPNANAGVIIGLDSGYNTGNSLTLKNAMDNWIIGVHGEGNSGYGIQLINADSNHFLKPYLEANALGDLKADSSSQYNYVDGHRRDQNTTSIVFDDPANNYVQGRSTTKGLFPFTTRQFVDVFGISKEGISGYWDIEQDGTLRDLVFTLMGTSSNANINFKSGGSGIVTLLAQQLKIGTGATIKNHINQGATIDFASIPANSTSDRTVTVTGVAIGDSVRVTAGDSSTPGTPLEAGLMVNAFVSATNTVTVRLANVTTGAIDPVSRVWKIDVWQH